MLGAHVGHQRAPLLLLRHPRGDAGALDVERGALLRQTPHRAAILLGGERVAARQEAELADGAGRVGLRAHREQQPQHALAPQTVERHQMDAQRVAQAVEPELELLDRPLAGRDALARELEREASLAHLAFLDAEIEGGGANALGQRATRGARAVELALEPRDLAAQRSELALSTGRRRAEEDEPHDENGGDAAQAAQKESTASSSDSMTSNTVTSCVICRMSLTLGGRPHQLQLAATVGHRGVGGDQLADAGGVDGRHVLEVDQDLARS